MLGVPVPILRLLKIQKLTRLKESNQHVELFEGDNDLKINRIHNNIHVLITNNYLSQRRYHQVYQLQVL